MPAATSIEADNHYILGYCFIKFCQTFMRYSNVKGIPKSTIAETTIIIKPVDVETSFFKFILFLFNYFYYIIFFYFYQFLFIPIFYLHVYLHYFRPNFIINQSERVVKHMFCAKLQVWISSIF